MRILHVINTLKTGGAPRLVSALVNALSKNPDIKVGVMVFEPSDDSPFLESLRQNPRVSLFENYGKKILSPSSFRALRKISKDFDIVHAHLFPTGYLASLNAIFGSKPLVYTEHSTFNKRRKYKFFIPIERIVYAGYDAVTAISPAVKQSLDSWLGKKKIASRTEVIYNGVDIENFAGEKRCSDIATLFGREGKPILMISRFVPAKDHSTLIRAIPLLKDSEAFVAFAGDGETLPQMEKLAYELNVSERCIFLGARQDIPRLISASKIGVQSSNWEGFGLTAVEMMSAGLPVLVSDVEGLREVVANNSLTFQPHNSEALADKINRLLSDEEYYSEMSGQALGQASKFSIDKMVDAHLELYSRLIKQ